MASSRLPSGVQVELCHEHLSAVVVEVGGGLRSLAVDGRELLDGYAADRRCTDARGQVLMPWPNRLRDGRYTFGGHEHQLPLSEPARGNAIHGLVRWANWQIGERAANRATLTCRVPPQSGYPFSLDLEVTYVLSGAGLEVRTTATNTGASPCPFAAGFHPYVKLDADSVDQLTVRAPAASVLVTDDRGIPTGRRPTDGGEDDFRQARRIGPTVLDTAYADLDRDPDGRARIAVTGPARGATVWLDGAYRYFMLFTGDSLPEPGRRRRALGIEPMTSPPNAFQSGEDLHVLAPGESFTAAWGIEQAAQVG